MPPSIPAGKTREPAAFKRCLGLFDSVMVVVGIMVGSGIFIVLDDRVATAVLQKIFPRFGPALMAFAIMLSTFGTVNALTLAGARACYAMSKDRLFFSAAGRLNRTGVPGWALGIQGLWSVSLVLPRTFKTGHGRIWKSLQ